MGDLFWRTRRGREPGVKMIAPVVHVSLVDALSKDLPPPGNLA